MYYNPMYYRYPYPYPYYVLNRQYPSVDTATFLQSVASFQKTATEAATILSKLAQPPFAQLLMSAAQVGNQHEVDRLIKSIGTTTPVITSYTPDGVKLTIQSESQGSHCCTLTMSLRWR